MDTVTFVKAVINSQHGWAVADQFETTYNDPTPDVFAERNQNAMDYVKQTVEEILDSGLFVEEVEDGLRYYLIAMETACQFWENK